MISLKVQVKAYDRHEELGRKSLTEKMCNDSNVLEFLIVIGRAFHRVGPATENALEPVLVFTRRTTFLLECDDRSCLKFVYGTHPQEIQKYRAAINTIYLFFAPPPLR